MSHAVAATFRSRSCGLKRVGVMMRIVRRSAPDWVRMSPAPADVESTSAASLPKFEYCFRRFAKPSGLPRRMQGDHQLQNSGPPAERRARLLRRLQ